MDQDFQLAMTFIKKNEKLFPYTDQEIRERFQSTSLRAPISGDYQGFLKNIYGPKN